MTQFNIQGVQVSAPASWSHLAVQITAQKYLRRRPNSTQLLEDSVPQMVERVVQRLLKTARQQSPKSKKARTRVDELKGLQQLCLHQVGFFNSPVWFNYGVYDAYGIDQTVPTWTFDGHGQRVVQKNSGLRYPQISACFIQSVEDNLSSIFELVSKEAHLFRFGSGTGTNFSNLRSRHELIQGGGYAAGVLSFLEVFDRSAAAIKSGGTTRRAAKMVILDVDHPEIEDFIAWKTREEKKVQALIAGGFSGGFEGEAYRTVSGQNSNNSIRLSDRFMRAVLAGSDWNLVSRGAKKKVIKKVQAKELFRALAQAAWASADPGVQFSDTINRWHTCPAGGSIRASNPCSEYLFLDDSACNLASLNLNHFIAGQQQFHTESFCEKVALFIRAQENLIDDAGYPSQQIAENSHNYRTLGLGFTGLGAILMKWGLPYDSPKGRAWATLITALMTASAYLESTILAQERGPFPAFQKNKKATLRVLTQHASAWKKHKKNLAALGLPQESLQKVSLLWQEVLTRAARYGVRNAQVTLLAPTGTIGLVMDSVTLGVEPEFSLLKMKTFAGGGTHQSFCEALLPALQAMGFDPAIIDEITQFARGQGTLQGCPLLTIEQSQVFATAMEISPQGHLAMMAAVQPFLSGAISKTVNMPRESTVEDIEKLFLQAWQLGLKSVAIYRDQSKFSQPLQALSNKSPIECETCS